MLSEIQFTAGMEPIMDEKIAATQGNFGQEQT
jgi:hypothetical protein